MLLVSHAVVALASHCRSSYWQLHLVSCLLPHLHLPGAEEEEKLWRTKCAHFACVSFTWARDLVWVCALSLHDLTNSSQLAVILCAQREDGTE